MKGILKLIRADFPPFCQARRWLPAFVQGHQTLKDQTRQIAVKFVAKAQQRVDRLWQAHNRLGVYSTFGGYDEAGELTRSA